LLEQLLSTGGGWQDQIGGLIGGLKLGTSTVNSLPVKTHVKRIIMKKSTIEKLNNQLVLVFTGQTRLAKNILQNVLRRWARRNREIVKTVESLVQDAYALSNLLEKGDIGAMADYLNRYWDQKKMMAGEQSGAEPEVVRVVLTELMARKRITAGALCGAGGGGFMVLLLAKDHCMEGVKKFVETELSGSNEGILNFTWHNCTVSNDGISTSQVTSDEFNLNWSNTTTQES